MAPDFVSVRLIGPPEVRVAGRPVKLPRRKSLALLCFLLMHERRVFSRERLAAMLWPDANEESARVCLRRALSDIGSVLGREWLDPAADGIQLRYPGLARTDVADLARMAPGASVTSEQLHHDVDAYCRGRFLEGLDLDGLGEWSEWLYFWREEVAQRQRRLLDVACSHAIGCEDAESAVAWSVRWMEADPLNDAAVRARMKAACLADDRAALPSLLASYGRRLRDELGIAPLPETIALFNRLQEAGLPAGSGRKRPEVRYVKCRDGVHVATSVIGETGPWMIFINGFVSHLDFLTRNPRLSAWFSRLAKGRRVLVFDKRGTGLSDRVGSAPGVERVAQDVMEIADAFGIESAYLMGVSEGGPVALCLAASQKAFVRGVVLYGTTARFRAAPDYPFALDEEQFGRWLSMLERDWGRRSTSNDSRHRRPGIRKSCIGGPRCSGRRQVPVPSGPC